MSENSTIEPEKKPFLQTANISDRVEKAEIPFRPSGGMLTTSGPKMSDAQYVARFAEPGELLELRQRIEQRRKNAPQQTFWICEKCGHRSAGGPDLAEPQFCLKCNWQQFKNGGWCRRMTVKEIKQFQLDQKREWAAAAERYKRAAYAAVNESRLKHGLKPYSWEEFITRQKKEYQLMKEREAALAGSGGSK